jgi:hypothetical protein
MPCVKPLQAYRYQDGQIKFHDNGACEPIELSCGQCITCRLNRSKEWALRMVHEAQKNAPVNCFITLTYNPENLPPDCGLVKRHYQLFIKRLRRAIARNDYPGMIECPTGKFKYYHCGEYGNGGRPHYHAVLFGCNFNDWVYLRTTDKGSHIYTSPTLEKIWGKGFVSIGECTFQSAAYVARYCLKKVTGKQADLVDKETGLKHYERFNSYTGEIIEVLPEYATMSRGGRTGNGIGYDWIREYTSDCYPKDFTTHNGMRMKPPKYYDKQLKEIDPDMYDDIKAGRKLAGFKSTDSCESRLSQIEKVKEAQNKQLKRDL